jgi:hypothetical protein
MSDLSAWNSINFLFSVVTKAYSSKTASSTSQNACHSRLLVHW